MCRWMGAACSVNLYATITHFFMTVTMICYGNEIETELVVGWLEVKLIRAFEVLVVGVV